jgi:glycosyltransferase involved in cell wall biosynthesis
MTELSIAIPTLPGRKPLLKEAIASLNGLPYEVEKDKHKTGAGKSRNRAVSRIKTEWVGFLDDDDEATPDYEERFREVLKDNPDADCIIFRMKFPDGRILPKVPLVEWGNVGIAFAVKTELIKKYPFVKGSDGFRLNEDYLALKKLKENGAKIVFCPYVTYIVKPSDTAQANARANN